MMKREYRNKAIIVFFSVLLVIALCVIIYFKFSNSSTDKEIKQISDTPKEITAP
jgi:flagellar basal body-associated protein FliL